MPQRVNKNFKTQSIDCVLYVHWCGNAGDFDKIVNICKSNDILLVEDAAQAPVTLYKDKYLGTYGDMESFRLMNPRIL